MIMQFDLLVGNEKFSSGKLKKIIFITLTIQKCINNLFGLTLITLLLPIHLKLIIFVVSVKIN